MNVRARESCTSSNSEWLVRLYRGISKSLFFLTYTEAKRSRSNTGEQFCLMLVFSLRVKES